MCIKQISMTLLGGLFVLLAAPKAGAENVSKAGGRIIKAWSIIEKEKDLSKFLERIKVLDEMGKQILEPEQEKISMHPKVLRELTELQGDKMKLEAFSDNLFFLFNLVTSHFKTKLPEQAIENPAFIYHFGNFLKRIWYAAAKDTCNIADFAPEFVKRVNEITRPHYVDFTCVKKTPAVSPDVEPACPEARTYTCGRAFVSDCTALEDHTRPRILLLGTYNENDDDIDVRQLKAFKLTEADVFSCEKANQRH